MMCLDTIRDSFELEEHQTRVNLIVVEETMDILTNSGAYVVKKNIKKEQVPSIGKGAVICRYLEVGEVMKLAVNCLLAMETDVVYDFQIIGRNKGDDLSCFATISGPGSVWLQSNSYTY